MYDPAAIAVAIAIAVYRYTGMHDGPWLVEAGEALGTTVGYICVKKCK